MTHYYLEAANVDIITINTVPSLYMGRDYNIQNKNVPNKKLAILSDGEFYSSPLTFSKRSMWPTIFTNSVSSDSMGLKHLLYLQKKMFGGRSQ